MTVRFNVAPEHIQPAADEAENPTEMDEEKVGLTWSQRGVAVPDRPVMTHVIHLLPSEAIHLVSECHRRSSVLLLLLCCPLHAGDRVRFHRNAC